ncbi:MAG: PQQ-dependent sugar dehydrogenase, partial [Deltaproteobacteria bacterium]|nr:PQQ-dependent sugar dehydrogenase [Deltaproteobacteria bacterium]
MPSLQRLTLSLLLIALLHAAIGCNDSQESRQANASSQGRLQSGGACQLVANGFGPSGAVPLHVEKVVTGLAIPWGLAFLPNGDWLVTERAGLVRLIRGGQLVPAPVARVATGESGEGGLLGIALHPNVAANGFFYVFYTSPANVNRVERFVLSA